MNAILKNFSSYNQDMIVDQMGEKIYFNYGDEVVVNFTIIKSLCTLCGGSEKKLKVQDLRPVLPQDHQLPVLLVVDGGNFSPRGALGFRKINESFCDQFGVEIPHYHRKDEKILLFLLKGQILRHGTRRYFDEGYFPAVEKTNFKYSGYFGYLESDHSTVFGFKDAEMLRIDEPVIKEKIHLRCEAIAKDLQGEFEEFKDGKMSIDELKSLLSQREQTVEVPKAEPYEKPNRW